MLPDRTDSDAVDITAEAESPLAGDNGLAESAAVDEAVADEPKTLAPAPAPVVDDPHHWDGPSVPFVPHHALLEGMMALGFLTLMLALVGLIPAPLDARANAYLSPTGVKPEWYFMAPFEVLHLVPALPGIIMCGVAVGVLIAWPFIDRKVRRISRRPLLIALAAVILIAILFLTIYPYTLGE